MGQQPYKFRKSVEKLIANLRGIPENYEGEAPKTERDINSVMDRLIRRYKIGEDSLEKRIVSKWAEIVGAANASNCAPSRIERERTLIVAVSNPVIRQELEFNKRLILQNLHRLEGARKIRSIVFKSG